jgi:hypothetical protein
MFSVKLILIFGAVSLPAILAVFPGFIKDGNNFDSLNTNENLQAFIRSVRSTSIQKGTGTR